jgi:adenylate kinase
MTRSSEAPPVNPFLTRRVRPGAIPFLFPSGINPARLVARLRQLGWRGAVVGPHGSGKSTLLESLRPDLHLAGRRVVNVCLHDGERMLPRGILDVRPSDRETVLMIDGYEQLSAWNRWRIERRCRRDGRGLLVTTHRPTRLPELYRTEVDGKLLERVVEHLLADRLRLITSAEVQRMFARHGENVRESLFALYDLHERRSRIHLARL